MDILEKKIELLKNILNDSRYTVMLGGSGMMKEGGYQGLKSPEQAYETEKKYGLSPEDIFTTVFYNNRTEQFFDFYRTEILGNIPQVTESAYVAARMEAAGKLQCIIESNIYELPQRGGCKNVISLHGSIYHNQCPHCGREYSMEYIRDSVKIPRCESCGRVIRRGYPFTGKCWTAPSCQRLPDKWNRRKCSCLWEPVWNQKFSQNMSGILKERNW